MDQRSDDIRDGYQAAGESWDPFRADIIALLDTAEQRDLQSVYYGSNHVFLVTLVDAVAGCSLAIYKPARGEYPLYDFPNGTLYRREVASFLISDILGWHLVPPTVETDGKYGAGSLQLFIEHKRQGEVHI